MSNLTNEAIEAARPHWTFLGYEMAYNHGIRAISAATAISAGIINIDALYQECETDIGKDYLHTNFDKDEMDLVEASGWGALHNYLALYQSFGPDWIMLALEAYYEREAGEESPMLAAHECFKRAHAGYSHFKARDHDAVKRWLKRIQGVRVAQGEATPDVRLVGEPS